LFSPLSSSRSAMSSKTLAISAFFIVIWIV
jgi:hypothetical protein